MPETLNYTFKNDYLGRDITRLLNDDVQNDNIRVSYVAAHDNEFCLALEQAFPFVSAHANGRYTDRTIMTIRRMADRYRSFDFNAEDASYHPFALVVESPHGWDPETEIKHGGIHAMLVGLPNDEGEYRGILVVAEHSRRRAIGKTLLQGARHITHSISFYASNTNMPAMRTAASGGFGAVQVNSSTGVVQYSHVDNINSRWRPTD